MKVPLGTNVNSLDIEGQSLRRTCEFCDGEGKVECMSCEGTLELPNEKSCTNCKKGQVDCPDCDGEGYVYL